MVTRCNSTPYDELFSKTNFDLRFSTLKKKNVEIQSIDEEDEQQLIDSTNDLDVRSHRLNLENAFHWTSKLDSKWKQKKRKDVFNDENSFFTWTS